MSWLRPDLGSHKQTLNLLGEVSGILAVVGATQVMGGEYHYLVVEHGSILGAVLSLVIPGLFLLPLVVAVVFGILAWRAFREAARHA